MLQYSQAFGICMSQQSLYFWLMRVATNTCFWHMHTLQESLVHHFNHLFTSKVYSCICVRWNSIMQRHPAAIIICILVVWCYKTVSDKWNKAKCDISVSGLFYKILMIILFHPFILFIVITHTEYLILKGLNL